MNMHAATPASSLAGRAGHAFTTETMVQGFTCHARGVELPSVTKARVHARVRGKRVHDVDLFAEGGRLLVSCSCPAGDYGLDVCKHAWAALLEVDRHGGLDDLRARRGMLKVERAPRPAAALPPPPPPQEKAAKEKKKPSAPATAPASAPENVPAKPRAKKEARAPRAASRGR